MRADAATREITCKIVYYGPGMSGKTTNLHQLHDRAPAHSVGDLVTLDTHSERTLHFDLLPMDVGQINGHKVRFEFYTVPGQSYYAATRRLVLEGADAVVFVADSRREALDENIDSMNDLFDNWRHLGLADDLPVVMQYNKQDLPSAIKPEQLDPLLNSRHWPSHKAVAVNGEGVVETMKTVAGLVLARIGSSVGDNSADLRAAAQASQGDANQTWLITCHRCQNMLEIAGAKQGDLFTCGACGTELEIVNLDRGLTRAPQRAAAPPPPPRQIQAPQPSPLGSSVPALAGEDSGYGLQALPDTGAALGRSGQRSTSTGTADLGAGFELPGFESLALLEETIQGRRFRVRDGSSGQRYRAMVVSPALVRQPGYAGQLEPYVRMAAKIRHANILPLNSMHQGRETPILLSADPVDHESLSHVLARRRTLAPPHAMQVAKQIALACEEAARQGVVHGWLRPDIILLNAESQVLVDEFGIPKHHHFLTRELSGASAATEYYLAPEHLREEARSDIRSDMFMLGALLFRMLTGEGLVTGYTCHEALHKVSVQGCRRARSAIPNLSRDLDNFVARLTAIDREERFETWKQVIDLCERFGGGAKQQTFRLTQTVQRSGGTGTVRRTSVGAGTSAARGTQNINRGTQSINRGTASYGRAPSGDRHLAAARGTPQHVRKQGGGGGIFVVLIVLLLVAGGVIFYLLGKPPKRPAVGTSQPTPTTTPTQPRPTPTTVQPAPPAQQAPAQQAPTPPAQPQTTNPDAGPNVQRLPGFMGGGPATGGGAAGTGATPAQATPPADPTPAPDPAPTTLSDDDFARIRLQITDALRSERYRAALDLCEQLPVDLRQAQSADIFARHQQRRAEVSAQVRQQPADARAILQNALTTWNMPGDADWAKALLDALPPAGASTGGTSQSGAKDDAARISWQVTKALLAGSTVQAEQALGSLAGADRSALQRRIDLWKARVTILKPAIAEKRRLLRITNPQDGQGWDVLDIEDGGLVITSSSGSTTRMDWALLPIKEFARITMEVSAARKEPEPQESALAVVLLTAADDVALAQVHLNRCRGSLDEALAGDLEHSIALHKAFAIRALIARADEALAKGDLKASTEAVEAVRRQRSDPTATRELPRLEEALAALQSGKPAGTSAPLRDSLTFDAPGDLDSLPLREGEWSVQDGTLLAQGPSGSLGRKDLTNARSVTLRFQTLASRGALSFNVRDVRILIDLQAQQLRATTRDTELKPVPVQVIARTLQSLYVEFRADGNVLVELNNGVVSLDLKLQKAGDGLTVGHDTGAAWALDEVSITREIKLDPAAEAARIDAIRAIGFEPVGRATLVPPAIHLPAGVPRSGIAFARRAGVASLTIDAKGTGKLEVRYGKVNEGGGQSVTLDLGSNADEVVTYTIGCGGQNVVIRKGGPDGEIIIDDRLPGDPPHVIILAQQEATITQTPRLNRQ